MYLLRGGARSAAGGPSAGLLLTEPFRGLAYLASPQLEVPENVIGTIRDWLGRTTPGTR
jgi:hypothetical protein